MTDGTYKTCPMCGIKVGIGYDALCDCGLDFRISELRNFKKFEGDFSWQCPRCHHAMQMLRSGKTFLGRCPGCQGNWIDLPAFSTYYENAKELLDQLTINQKSGEFNCPGCREKSMVSVPLPDFEIEICLKCHSFFFDKDEMSRTGRLRAKPISLENNKESLSSGGDAVLVIGSILEGLFEFFLLI